MGWLLSCEVECSGGSLLLWGGGKVMWEDFERILERYHQSVKMKIYWEIWEVDEIDYDIYEVEYEIEYEIELIFLSLTPQAAM